MIFFYAYKLNKSSTRAFITEAIAEDLRKAEQIYATLQNVMVVGLIT